MRVYEGVRRGRYNIAGVWAWDGAKDGYRIRDAGSCFVTGCVPLLGTMGQHLGLGRDGGRGGVEKTRGGEGVGVVLDGPWYGTPRCMYSIYACSI